MLTPLKDALNLNGSVVVAFVGAGGKTSASWRLSNEFVKLNQRVIVAPTTHILEPRFPDDSITYLGDQPDPDQLINLLNQAPRVILAAARGGVVDFEITDEVPPARSIKLRGLRADTLDHLIPLIAQGRIKAIWLIEADGARRHLLKAPADHEPSIPTCAEVVVIVASLDAIDRPLNESIVHRWEKFAELAEARLGQPITAELIARVILHEQGGLKNIPPAARVCVVLTQRESAKLHPAANSLTDQLLASNLIERVIVASLRAEQPIHLTRSRSIKPVAAVILAAGESTRFGGKPKQLTGWHGRTFVQITIDSAIEAGLDPILVVIGSHADEVRANISDRKVTIIENKDWQLGQSTSVRAGLQALPSHINAALFMPIDQPNLSPQIVRTIVASYRSTGKPIVVASVNGKRTTPVLFDRSLFSEIMKIEGDRGPRELIDRKPDRVHKVEIDPRAAMDIDTLDDYDKLLKEKESHS